mmetsp:Transcript_45919/g.127569  ORF Transcript_45919/g.127569 Transcript_45919/m.127569 type:complete len:171 (+) Transcript_45919:438-950(+)
MSVQDSKEWGSGTYDCFGDIPICAYISCCTPCAVFFDCGGPVALAPSLLEPDMQGCKACICYGCANGYCTVCNIMCDCPCGKRYVGPCYYSAMLDKMVEVYGLPYPAPCGDSECCGAKYQMCCCEPCTVCLIARELKARGVAPGQVAATGASATVGVPVAAGAPAEVMER